jgi:PhzF family phenazine biosynthesis protein
MKIPIYQVDAFAGQLFSGNPAAVCPLEAWLPDQLLQSIGQENNLSETAYYLEEDQEYRLRWFTPGSEVNLCGHATLATAHVLFFELGYQGPELVFQTLSGKLVVRRTGSDQYQMDFPLAGLEICEPPAGLIDALGRMPREVFRSREDIYAVYDSQADVESLNPNMFLLRAIDCRGIGVTAPGDGESDFVSRFFAPGLGIPEDPVTGSAHCSTAPYWSEKLDKTRFKARQVSNRGGDLDLQISGNRLLISGQARTYMKGHIYV